jgi:hypothetical protein
MPTSKRAFLWLWLDGCWFDRLVVGMAGSAVAWRSFWCVFLVIWGSIGGTVDLMSLMSIAAFFFF